MTVERLSVWNTTGPKRPFLAVRAEAYDALEADRDHLRADLAAAEREAEFLRGELAKAAPAVRGAAAPSPPEQPTPCPACGGSGDRNGNLRASDPFGTCPGCDGRGIREAVSPSPPDTDEGQS